MTAITPAAQATKSAVLSVEAPGWPQAAYPAPAPAPIPEGSRSRNNRHAWCSGHMARLRALAFIDPRVDDAAALLGGVRPGVASVLLDARGDALSQIEAALAAHARAGAVIEAIHLVAHGAPGVVHIGAQGLTGAVIAARAQSLARIGAALAGGEILLWSCEAARGVVGGRFVAALEAATGASVAASAGLIGAAALGGAWELAPASAAPFSAAALQSYAGVLTSPTVTGVSSSASRAGSLNAGQTVTFSVTLSAAQDVTGTPSLSLNDGATASYSSGSGGSTLIFTYIVGASQTAANLTATALNLNGGTIGVGSSTASFGTQTTYATGTAPRSVTTADVNGDGKADIIVVNGNSSSVGVLLGNGSGGFGTQTTYATGAGPSSVTTADETGDGKADIITANYNSNNVSVLLGNGSGGFGTQTTYGVGSTPYSVTTADVNGDGKADIIVVNYNSNSVSVLLGDGSGGFGTQTTYATGSRPYSATTADVNGDGKADIIVANSSSNNVGVLLNNASFSVLDTSSFTSSISGAATGIVVDTTAPTITAISLSPNSNATYGPNTTFTLSVSLSEAATLSGGTPTIALSNGGTASYVSGSGSTVLLFTYHPTTADGHQVSAAALSTSASAISLNGATLTDAASNAATLTGANSQTLAATITIDTTAPTITGITTNDAGLRVGPGAVVTLTVTTSEAATVTGAPTILLNNGATATYASGSGSTALSFTYTVGATGSGQDTASLATATLNALSGTLNDASGNTMVSTAANAITPTGSDTSIDTTAPSTPSAVSYDAPSGDLTITAAEAGTAQVYDSTGSVLIRTQAVSAGAGQIISLAGLDDAGSGHDGYVTLTDAAGNVSGPSSNFVICFMPGTRIATPDAEVAVEALKIGDLVRTADGADAPVRWIGRQTVSTRFADPLRVLPIRIRAGALAENLPVRDLLLSPGHAVLLNNCLIQAGALVNGASIVRDHQVPEIFTYYHIELADHALILAEGVAAETFIDTVDRMVFDNWAEHEALYGTLPPQVEMDLPRAKSHRQVAMTLRRQLAERCKALAMAMEDAT